MSTAGVGAGRGLQDARRVGFEFNHRHGSVCGTPFSSVSSIPVSLLMLLFLCLPYYAFLLMRLFYFFQDIRDYICTVVGALVRLMCILSCQEGRVGGE